MADVDVTFGAKIDELISKVDQVNQSLSGIGKQAQEATNFFSSLGDGIMSALSVEAVWKFVEGMAKLGAETQKSMDRLNASAETIGTLQGVARLTGVEFRELETGIERISLGVQRSKRDAFDPAAQALRVLGLRADDLIGLPTDQYFSKLADAVSKLNPGLNTTNALMTLGGRGIVQMLPLLQKGSDGYREFQESIRRTGSIMTEAQVNAFAKTDDSIGLLILSLKGLGIQLFTLFQPAILAVIKSLTDTVQWFTRSSTEGGLLELVFHKIGQAAKVAATAIMSLMLAKQALFSSIEVFLSIPFKGMDAITEYTKKIEEIGTKWKTIFQEIWGLADKPIRINIPNNKGNTPAMDFGAKQAIQAQQEALDAQRQIEQQRLARARLTIDQLVNLERISAADGVRMTAQKTEESYRLELALLQKSAALWAEGSLERARINRQIQQAEEVHATQMLQINQQLVTTLRNRYMEVFTSIQSAWDSQLRGLLGGTLTWAQAFKNILGDLLIEFIKWGEKKLLIYIAGEMAETEAKAAGTAARIGLSETEAAANMFSVLTRALKSIMTSVGETFAGVTAFLSPVMGPAAPAAGAGVAAGVEASALAMLPSFDVGAWNLPGDMVARVHQGEMIVPAGPADAVRDMLSGKGAGGGGGVSFNINALDGQSVEAWLRRGGAAQLATAISKHQRDNPRTRRAK